MKRREFLKTTVAIGAPLAANGLGGPLFSLAAAAEPAEPAAATTAELSQTKIGDMLYRPLGRTGEKVSLLGLGGFHVGTQPDAEQSIRLIRRAIDRGVTFLDNCWDYNGGQSEIRMGQALQQGYRAKVFLMTKIDGRTRDAAARQIDQSLQRLRTDRLDLLQFHEIIRLEDPDRIFAEGGGMEAALAAQKAGKIRFIGFTGHKDPLVHLRMLDIADEHNFHFDAVQMPLNLLDAHFRSFQHQVLPRLVRQQIGVLGMKSLASGQILASRTATATECLHYAMNLPTSTVISGMDRPEVLQQNLDAVRTFRPLAEGEVAELLAKTAKAAAGGRFEPFKTSSRYDGTAHNPQWLG
jgi:aryl-alcohol dehydrogenase-like predicted oxidoreductase